MVERIYKCDLCREKRDVEDLIGIWYVGSPPFKIEKRHPTSTEKHVCKDCLRELKNL